MESQLSTENLTANTFNINNKVELRQKLCVNINVTKKWFTMLNLVAPGRTVGSQNFWSPGFPPPLGVGASWTCKMSSLPWFGHPAKFGHCMPLYVGHRGAAVVGQATEFYF